MSGRGRVYEILHEPVVGMVVEFNGYRYHIQEIFSRRNDQFRLRTLSMGDGRQLEVWFTVKWEGHHDSHHTTN